MKRFYIFLLLGIAALLTLSACSGTTSPVTSENATSILNSQDMSELNSVQGEHTMQEYTDTSENQPNADSFTIKISVNGTELTAVLENNATTRALVEQMPMTLPMRDLYDREMCYNYGSGAFPTETLRNDSYQVGDIIYWPTAGSFVILYRQNGEQFSRQHLGHIESGVEVFETTGDTNVTFELIS